MIIFIIALSLVAIIALRFDIMWLKYDKAEDLLYALMTNSIVLIGASAITLVYESILLLICVIGQLLVVAYFLYKVTKLKL